MVEQYVPSFQNNWSCINLNRNICLIVLSVSKWIFRIIFSSCKKCKYLRLFFSKKACRSTRDKLTKIIKSTNWCILFATKTKNMSSRKLCSKDQTVIISYRFWKMKIIWICSMQKFAYSFPIPSITNFIPRCII